MVKLRIGYFGMTVTAAVALTAAGCDPGPDEGTQLDQPQTHASVSQSVDQFNATELAPACAVTVNTSKELMIRALSVVEDSVRTKWTGSMTDPKDGAWHFGRLIANMAGTNNPSTFVRNWLASWESDRTINSFVVPARTAIRDLVINPWPKTANGSLDLTKAPMRLLAIVNRIDLRNLSEGHAGEGRFVFGVLGPSGVVLPFSVIMEYRLPASTEADVSKWAQDWHALGALTVGSTAYRNALQRITDRFAGKGVAPSRPNGSAIGQIRTNEIALFQEWELREFQLSATTGLLTEVTVRQEPHLAFNGSATLARFINANQTAILNGTHTVPLSFESQPFRAAASANRFNFWNAPGINSNQARHLLSLNTCSGCHGRETSCPTCEGSTTSPVESRFFFQINPRQAGQVAALSGFLMGRTVPDPVTGQNRTFNDLARRNTDLKNLLCATSSSPATGS